MSKQESIGGMWCNKTKQGEEYFSGTINGIKIVAFKNTYKKEGEKSPDYKVFASVPKET